MVRVSGIMSARKRARLTWFLTAVFAAISVVGEGLHSLPGFGHLIACPGGCYGVGWCPAATFSADGLTRHVGSPPEDVPPIRDPEQCPVCRHLSFSSPAAEAVVIPAISDLVQELSVWDLPPLRFITAPSAQARAPPAV
jgi:hypothetical protein